MWAAHPPAMLRRDPQGLGCPRGAEGRLPGAGPRTGGRRPGPPDGLWGAAGRAQVWEGASPRKQVVSGYSPVPSSLKAQSWSQTCHLPGAWRQHVGLQRSAFTLLPASQSPTPKLLRAPQNPPTAAPPLSVASAPCLPAPKVPDSFRTANPPWEEASRAMRGCPPRQGMGERVTSAALTTRTGLPCGHLGATGQLRPRLVSTYHVWGHLRPQGPSFTRCQDHSGMRPGGTGSPACAGRSSCTPHSARLEACPRCRGASRWGRGLSMRRGAASTHASS